MPIEATSNQQLLKDIDRMALVRHPPGTAALAADSVAGVKEAA